MASNSPSIPRRQLERDMADLMAAHGMEGIVHALVEACHARAATLRESPRRRDWQEMCAALTHLEQVAQERKL